MTGNIPACKMLIEKISYLLNILFNNQLNTLFIFMRHY